MAKIMNETAVIIANWNGKTFLKDCLDSMRGQTYRNFKIILVDNGSGDDSVFFVEKNYPEVETVKLEKNTGFAYANNLGIKKAFEDANVKYIITLNNDTKADPEYLEKLVDSAKKHPEAGSIQPKVLNFYEKNKIDSVGILIYLDASAINRGQKEEDRGQYENEEEIFGPSASAALYTREALEKTKFPNGDYFDSDYFAYYEDVDLAWRMRLAGFKSFYCPKAIIYHIHSATGINYSPFKAFHSNRNQIYNLIKNFPTFLMIRGLLFIPVRYLLMLVSILIKKGPAARLKTNKVNPVLIILQSTSDVVRNMLKLIGKRKIIQKNRQVSNRDVRIWLKLYRADLKKMLYG